jgi:hypothetical protein
MKRLLLVTVALVAVLTGITAQSAGAHNTTWYWNAYKAQQNVRDTGLDWRQGYDQVEYVRCTGYGDWIRGNRSQRLYRHFNCYIEARYEDPYWITFHVTGRTTWDYSWLYWD